MQGVLPAHTVARLIDAASAVLEAAPSLVEIRLGEDEDIVIVGDIHGQVTELKTKVKRWFAKISQSWIRPLLEPSPY